MATLEIKETDGQRHPELKRGGGDYADCSALLLTQTTEVDTGPADKNAQIKYEEEDFKSVTVLLGAGESQQTLEGVKGVVAIPLSLEAGEEQKDVVFTLQVVLKNTDNQGGADNDWSFDGNTWSLDPYVRIRRESYRISQ